MSGVKSFHKKEAARILIELRSKTEDEKLMDYRRQLLQNDESMNISHRFNDFQEQLQQTTWLRPWAYPNPPPIPQYNPNTVPFGYPCMTNNNNMSISPVWSPSPPCAELIPPMYNQPPSYQGMDLQHTFLLPSLATGNYPGYVDPEPSRRRRPRTKFTSEQVEDMEKVYIHSKFPSPEEQMRLEKQIGVTRRKILVWFQNRRAKEKKLKKLLEEASEETGESSTDTSDENETKHDVYHGAWVDTAEQGRQVEENEENKENASNGSASDAEITSARMQAFSSDKITRIEEEKSTQEIQKSPSSGLESSGDDSSKDYLRNLSKQSEESETSSDDNSNDNESDITNIDDVIDSEVIKRVVNAVSIPEDHNCNNDQEDDMGVPNKKRKVFPAEQDKPRVERESYGSYELRL